LVIPSWVKVFVMFHASEQVQAIFSPRGTVMQLLVGILRQCDADSTLIEAVKSLDVQAAEEWFANSSTNPTLKSHLALVVRKAFEQFALLEGIDETAIIHMSDKHVDMLEQLVYQGINQAIAYMGAPKDGEDKDLRRDELQKIITLLDDDNLEDRWAKVNDLVKQNRSNFSDKQMFDIGQLVTLHWSYVFFTEAAFAQYRSVFAR